MIPARVRALLATAALGVLPFVALALPGTPDAGAPVLVAASGEPTPSPTMILPIPTSPPPSAEPTPQEPSPTPAATSAAPTASPTPKKTSAPVRTVSPRPRTTQTATETVTSTATPITGGLDVGVVPQATEAGPTATPIGAKPAASRSSTDKVARLITLVVGGAVLLGAGGAAGLYLTRHRG